jgi:ubiquinone/menaquinone biosynthesis C-methylase UbiE
MELLGLEAGGRVLLVGEAEGLLAARLGAEHGARVVWMDPAPAGLGTAGPTPGDRGAARLSGSCYDTPFEAGEFDAVVSQFAVEYLVEPVRALVEWRRVLKDAGTLVIVSRNALFKGSDWRPRPRATNSFTPAGLRGMLEGSGFEVLRLCTLIPDLKLPRLYRGDLSFSYWFERLPYFGDRGMLLFASAAKRPGGNAGGDQGRA